MNWQNGVENPSYGRGAGNRVVPTTTEQPAGAPGLRLGVFATVEKPSFPPFIENTKQTQNSPPLLPRRKISRRKSIGLFFQKPIFPRKFGRLDGGEEKSTFSLLDAYSTLYKTTARPKAQRGELDQLIACRSASGRSVSRTDTHTERERERERECARKGNRIPTDARS